jgi:hypothetical protein
MKVLICGDREWDDRSAIAKVIDRLSDDSTVIHGAARGADSIAGELAAERGLNVRAFPAEWHRYGRGAGPRRNQQMLDEGQPNLVVAFHSNLDKSRGTADMVRRARKAGLPVEVVGGSV